MHNFASSDVIRMPSAALEMLLERSRNYAQGDEVRYSHPVFLPALSNQAICFDSR